MSDSDEDSRVLPFHKRDYKPQTAPERFARKGRGTTLTPDELRAEEAVLKKHREDLAEGWLPTGPGGMSHGGLPTTIIPPDELPTVVKMRNLGPYKDQDQEIPKKLSVPREHLPRASSQRPWPTSMPENPFEPLSRSTFEKVPLDDSKKTTSRQAWPSWKVFRSWPWGRGGR
ncbi:hypothetical protein JCM16303_002326 [Sporobolomyces ruberrimus]